MELVLVACGVTAVLTLLALLVSPRGAVRQQVAGWGAVANAVAVVVSAITALGVTGQRMLHHLSTNRLGVWIFLACLATQLLCSITVRLGTRPHRVPTHVDPEWRIPNSSTTQTLLVYDVVERDGAVFVSAVTAAGAVVSLPTVVSFEQALAWQGRRGIGMIADDQRTLLDVFDLGEQLDDVFPQQAHAEVDAVASDPDHGVEVPTGTTAGAAPRADATGTHLVTAA